MSFTKPKPPDPDYQVGQLVRTRVTGDLVVRILNVWPMKDGDETAYRVKPEKGKGTFFAYHGQITEAVTHPKRDQR
jgi:hypothetical protein